MINYRTYSPPESLKPYVRFFWVLEHPHLHGRYIYRSMADSCAELIFHYRGRFDEIETNGNRVPSFRSGIHSQTDLYRRFITREPFGIFGAYLYPFAVRRLLNLSPAELANRMPDLHSALGREGISLEEQMMLAPDNMVRYRLLSGFLEKKLLKENGADSHPVQAAVRYLIRSNHTGRVNRLADRFHLSERQFERKFKEYTGFTPKRYMRIIRFSSACDLYQYGGHKSLAEIALMCGYYDQSHFTREFREFSGYNPAHFFSGQAEGTEWREQ